MTSPEKPSTHEKPSEQAGSVEQIPVAPESVEPVSTPEPTPEEAARRAEALEGLQSGSSSEEVGAPESTPPATAAKEEKKTHTESHGTSEIRLGLGGFFTVFLGMLLAGAANGLRALGKAAGIKFDGGGGGESKKASGGGGGHH